MASSGGGEAGAASASALPRLRGDSITDDDPWIANKRFDVVEGGGGGRQDENEKGGGGRGLLSPRFLKRSKRSETAGTASREKDKALVAALIDREKGKSTKKKGSVGSADDLASPHHPLPSDEPKSPRGRARGQLLRSFSQTALVDSRNKSELAKRERLKKSGEVSTLAAEAGAARSPRSDSAARTAAAASQAAQGLQLNKSAPRFHSFSQQEKKEFEQKIKGSNIQFFRSTKKSKKGPIYRNVLEDADQALPWPSDVDTGVVEVADSAEAEVSDDDDVVSERRAKLRRGSDSSDPGSSDCDDTSPRPKRKITSPPVPLLSPRGGGALLSPPTSPKASYLTPEQLKEMVRERKLEIKREREREKREEKEKAKRDKEELKQKKQAAVKRTHSRDDQPFPGISLANDKVKSLLERESSESAAGSATGEDRPTTPRRPSQAAEEYMESPRSVPPPLTLSQAGAVAVRAGTGTSPPTTSDQGAVHSSPVSPRVGVSDSPQKAAAEDEVALQQQHKKKLEQARQQKEQQQNEQEQREKQLKLEAERRRKYKKQISIHLGMSKQQRRSRSFSDLTHYFTDQPDDKAQGRKKDKKEKKEKKEKKDKKEKKEKKDKHAAVSSKDAPSRPLVPEVTVTESTVTGSSPRDAPAVDKEQPKSEAATVLPRIAIATGQDREQELREIREMLSFRTKKKDEPSSSTTAAAGPVDRKSARERRKTLYRSNSEQHLKLLTAKIPSMLLQEKISGGKGQKSQIVLSRPERELIDRQVDIAEKMDEMNRGKNGSRVRKQGDKVAKDRLRANASGAGGDSDGESEEESDNEKNEEEQKNEGQVFVQVQRGPVFGMTLDEVMRLQQSSTSPPTSPQPSPSLTSPLSGSPMSCSPPGSPLGMSASMSSVNTAAAVHFTLSKDEAKLPVVLTALANGILELGGTQMTGLFRVPGKKSTMDVIRDRLNSGIYQFEEGTCPHDLASLLKEWLKSITPPLIPLELYDRCVEVSGRPNDCVEVIEKSLPDLNKRIIKYVVRFLQQQILSPEVQRATRMDIRSIATAFAPCFLDNPLLSMEELVKNIQAHIKFMVNLLMLLNVNVGKISSNAVPVRKLKDGADNGVSASPSNEEAEAAAKESEGSRIIPKMVNDRFKKWQERSKTKGSASARVTRGERKRSIEKRE